MPGVFLVRTFFNIQRPYSSSSEIVSSSMLGFEGLFKPGAAFSRARIGLAHTAIGAKTTKVWEFLSSEAQTRVQRETKTQAARVVKSVRSVPPLPTVASAR